MDLASRLMFALMGPRHEYRAKRFYKAMMVACLSLALRMRGDEEVWVAVVAFDIDKNVLDDATRYLTQRLDLACAIERV